LGKSLLDQESGIIMEADKKEVKLSEKPEEKISSVGSEDDSSAASDKKEEESSDENSALETVTPEGSSEPLKIEKKDAPDMPTSILTSMTHDEKTFFLSMAGLSTFVRSTSRLFWTNFLMGLARGIGFVIGMSIVGAIVVGLWNEMISVTGIGKFIARILEEVHNSKP